MRLLKSQNTNLRNIYGNGVKFDINQRVVMDTTQSLLVPKGTTAERPHDYDNNPTSEAGEIRFNTTTGEFEFYQNGEYRIVRFREPSPIGIQVQLLGTGDGTETKFGTLDSGDPDYPIPATEASILVFVENVYQLPYTNYTLIQNPTGTSPSTGLAYPAGWYIDFGASPLPPDIGKPITVIHNFDK